MCGMIINPINLGDGLKAFEFLLNPQDYPGACFFCNLFEKDGMENIEKKKSSRKDVD